MPVTLEEIGAGMEKKEKDDVAMDLDEKLCLRKMLNLNGIVYFDVIRDFTGKEWSQIGKA